MLFPFRFIKWSLTNAKSRAAVESKQIISNKLEKHGRLRLSGKLPRRGKKVSEQREEMGGGRRGEEEDDEQEEEEEGDEEDEVSSNDFPGCSSLLFLFFSFSFSLVVSERHIPFQIVNASHSIKYSLILYILIYNKE
jgi:hypothetical protein